MVKNALASSRIVRQPEPRLRYFGSDRGERDGFNESIVHFINTKSFVRL